MGLSFRGPQGGSFREQAGAIGSFLGAFAAADDRCLRQGGGGDENCATHNGNWNDGVSWRCRSQPEAGSIATAPGPARCLPNRWWVYRVFRGGTAGPVLLAPGFGMSSDHYLLDITAPNLTEVLVAAGYDVWLFDYRSSILFPGAGTPSNLDEIARLDWPAAVNRVRSEAGSGGGVGGGPLRRLGHGADVAARWVGGVGSVVCSQMSAHFDVPGFTRLRARLRPGPKLEALGFTSVFPDRGTGLSGRLADLAVRSTPLAHGERCDSPVCRWVFFFYGPTHAHANLDRYTHDRIAELFGEGSLRGAWTTLAPCSRPGDWWTPPVTTPICPTWSD